MSSMAETQGGEVLEEVELADDRAHQFSQGHDEGRNSALDAPAGCRSPKLGRLLASGSLEHSVPVPDMPAMAFAFDIPIPATHVGVLILVFVQRVDVAHEGTPRRPAGRFRLVVPPQHAQIVKLAHQLRHLFVWCAGVRRIAPEHPRKLVNHRARAHLASMHCSQLSSSYEHGPGEGRMQDLAGFASALKLLDAPTAEVGPRQMVPWHLNQGESAGQKKPHMA